MGTTVYYSVHPKIRSILHFAIPQELKRGLFKLILPAEFKRQQELRTNEAEWSYKPFDENQCIFVHIPKTGGISIANSLFGQHGAGHASLQWYQIIYNRREFKKFYKFAFVRNPWDRLVSAFTFMKRGGMNNKNKQWAEQNLSNYQNFDDFVKGWLNRKNIYQGIHFVPQFEFICLGNKTPAVDFIGRFENLAKDFATLRAKLGKDCELQKLNFGAKKDYRDFYTDETRQIVAEVYREDIKIFGYDFDNLK